MGLKIDDYTFGANIFVAVLMIHGGREEPGSDSVTYQNVHDLGELARMYVAVMNEIPRTIPFFGGHFYSKKNKT